MSDPTTIQQQIEEYLDRVAQHLAGQPPQYSRNVLNDLEAQIQEAVAVRAAGRDPTPGDVKAVLDEMDPPESFLSTTNQPNWFNRYGLGVLALAVSLAGPLILTIQVAGFGPWYHRSSGPVWPLLLPIILCQLAAIVLGIMAWKQPLGKAAVVIASVILIGGVFMTS